MPPARVMEILSIDRNSARASADGITQDICLDIIDTRPTLGDRVVVHAGFALHCIKQQGASEPIEFIREMMERESVE